MNLEDITLDGPVEAAINNLSNSVEKIEKLLDEGLNWENYDNLSLKDKVNHDLFIAYTLNTLYWIYLRTKGIDPNTDEVKNELKRIKDYMLKAKQVI